MAKKEKDGERDVRVVEPYGQLVDVRSRWASLRAPAQGALALFSVVGVPALAYWGAPLAAYVTLGVVSLTFGILLKPP